MKAVTIKVKKYLKVLRTLNFNDDKPYHVVECPVGGTNNLIYDDTICTGPELNGRNARVVNCMVMFEFKSIG